MGPAHETRRHLPLHYYLMGCLQHISRHGELRNFLEQSWKPASFDDGIVQITLFIFCTGIIFSSYTRWRSVFNRPALHALVNITVGCSISATLQLCIASECRAAQLEILAPDWLLTVWEIRAV